LEGVKTSEKRKLRLRAGPVFGFIPIRGSVAHKGTALLRANLRERSVGDAVIMLMSHAHELGMNPPWHNTASSPSENISLRHDFHACWLAHMVFKGKPHCPRYGLV